MPAANTVLMGGGLPISPELALIDPALREEAVRALPALEAFDFLRRRAPSAPPPVTLERPALPLPVAALVYLVVTALRFAATSLLLLTGVVVVTLVLALLSS